MFQKPKKPAPEKKKRTQSATVRMEARKQSATGWKHHKEKTKKA